MQKDMMGKQEKMIKEGHSGVQLRTRAITKGLVGGSGRQKLVNDLIIM